MAVDPDGRFVFVPLIIGAAIGAYMGASMANQSFNPGDWDMGSGRTWGYMAGGALVGGLSGAVGGLIASGGGVMANTASIIASSSLNSIGTALYTGGQTDISVNFGAGSYNWNEGKFDGIWNWGSNSTMENVGYSLGAMANVSDVLAGANPAKVQLNTEKSDNIGHSALTKVGETDTKTSYVSFGPNRGGSWIYNPFKFKAGTNHWSNYVDAGDDVLKITVKGVNINTIAKYGDALNNGVKYNLYLSSCVNHTARALTLSGVPAIGIHPFILHAQMYFRSIGIRPMLFSYYFNQF